MDNKNELYDDFLDLLDNDLVIEKKDRPFKLTQLKLVHYHYNSGDIDFGMPLYTSIELNSYYDYETKSLKWKKIVSHTYISLEDLGKQMTNTFDEELFEANKVIPAIETNDLRVLKNNYFNDDKPNCFSHWEINYNNYFKISGTYDMEIDIVKNISDILDFKNVIKSETAKINKLHNQN